MAFFNSEVPLISRKQPVANVPVSPNVRYVQWNLGFTVLWSSFYTRHDLACLSWGVLTASIFAVAQFLPLSWITQAMITSVLTGLGSFGMACLAWRYTNVEKLAWILYTWLTLMLIGTIVTDLSVWYGWGVILMKLCPLWLGLCGIGYLITGLGMRSRLILICGAIHLLAIGLLPFVGPWQILLTGIVISGCVIALAELQWDSNGVCNYQSLY